VSLSMSLDPKRGETDDEGRVHVATKNAVFSERVTASSRIRGDAEAGEGSVPIDHEDDLAESV